jgi:hypothetical protein
VLTEYGVQVNKRKTGAGNVIVREFDGEGFALDSIRFWSLVFAAPMLTASAGQGRAEGDGQERNRDVRQEG